MAELFASLSEPDRDSLLESITADEAKLLLYDWKFWARPDQLEPEGELWSTWLVMAGRGFGKTRTGAEWLREKARRPMRRLAMVSPTAGDARDIMVEGESGLLACYPRDDRPRYEPSKRRITWKNGTQATIYSADEPERLRGPQHHYAWCVAAGIIVATRRGGVPIESVQAGDEVWTRSGWRSVLRAGKTGHRETIAIRTADGAVRCTPDHRVWVEGRGWTLANTVAHGDTMLTCSPTALRHGSNSKAFAGTTAIAWGAIATERGCHWLKRYGQTRTVRSLRGSTCITSTATALTTKSKTLFSCPLPSTSTCTPPRMAGKRRAGETVVRPTHTSVLRPTVRPSTVLSVERNSASDVYDITVDGASEFFAGGLLVHNCDEIAAWKYPGAWDMLAFGMRLGSQPRTIATTTPKPRKFIIDLVKDKETHVTYGSTYDNRRNLAGTFLTQIVKKYEGTTLGRQELSGELLEESPGALWKRGMIDALRVTESPAMSRIVVALDPAVTSSDESDETGIIVAGKGYDGHGYILEDISGRFTPDTWAAIAIAKYRQYSADRIIGEVNNGGDLIEAVLRGKDRSVSYKKVHASRGKAIRAEPVSALYEQGRVHHVGGFGLLEDQMCQWSADSDISPDRLDALVWALTELMIINSQGPDAAPAGATGSSKWRI